MFEWISQNSDYFLRNYTEIGDSHATSFKVQQQHSQFSVSAMVSHFLSFTHFSRLAHSSRLCS